MRPVGLFLSTMMLIIAAMAPATAQAQVSNATEFRVGQTIAKIKTNAYLGQLGKRCLVHEKRADCIAAYNKLKASRGEIVCDVGADEQLLSLDARFAEMAELKFRVNTVALEVDISKFEDDCPEKK